MFLHKADQIILVRNKDVTINTTKKDLVNGYFIDQQNYFIGFKNFYRLFLVERNAKLFVKLFDINNTKMAGWTNTFKILNDINFELVTTTNTWFRNSSGIQECSAHGGGWWWYCDALIDFIPTLKDKIVYNGLEGQKFEIMAVIDF